MKEKQRYKAEIAGKIYTIVGNRSVQHLDAVVELINGQLQQLGDLAPNLSVEDRSILMAINAISDQIEKENQIIELEAQIEMTESEISRMRQYQAKKIEAEKQKIDQTAENPTTDVEGENSYHNNLAVKSTISNQTSQSSEEKDTFSNNEEVAPSSRNDSFKSDAKNKEDLNVGPQNFD